MIGCRSGLLTVYLMALTSISLYHKSIRLLFFICSSRNNNKYQDPLSISDRLLHPERNSAYVNIDLVAQTEGRHSCLFCPIILLVSVYITFYLYRRAQILQLASKIWKITIKIMRLVFLSLSNILSQQQKKGMKPKFHAF
jgi:hypothetical protein